MTKVIPSTDDHINIKGGLHTPLAFRSEHLGLQTLFDGLFFIARLIVNLNKRLNASKCSILQRALYWNSDRSLFEYSGPL